MTLQQFIENDVALTYSYIILQRRKLNSVISESVLLNSHNLDVHPTLTVQRFGL